MGGGYNTPVYSNSNTAATTYTSACTDAMPTSTWIINLIVNNDALSISGGFNPTVSTNTNIMYTGIHIIIRIQRHIWLMIINKFL